MSIGDPLAPLRGGPGLIRVHGHRGARGIFPENSMRGFDYVLATGVNAIEFDVLATCDGMPVLTHNPRLMADTTRGYDGAFLAQDGPRVVDMTLAELQRYDVGAIRPGSHYAQRYPDQARLDGAVTPTLADFCALIARPEHARVWLNLEVKSDPRSPEDVPPARDYVAAVLEVLREHGLMGRTVFQCFDWRILHEAARQAPELPRSYLSYAPPHITSMDVTIFPGSPWMDGVEPAHHGQSLPRAVAADGGRVWSPYYEDITPSALAEAHAAGLVVNVWTVNRAEDIDAMIDIGVDGIISDYPARVQRQLLERGMDWRGVAASAHPAPETSAVS